MASANKTRNHETIKHWIEAHGGQPAVVRDTQNNGEGAGLLRIKFDKQEDKLEEIEWDEFFDTFDDKDLTFLYQSDEPGSRESRFFKFIHD